MKSDNSNTIENDQPLSDTAVNINSILAHVKKPSRYIGKEFNAVKKDWQSVAVKVALVFPDLYEIGMSHHGLHILYRIINSQDTMLAERVYAPDKDLEALLRKKDWPIFSLESRAGLMDFDMVGITLPFELCYTNILTILDLGKIPLRASKRDGSHPFIIGGGSGSFNPEPVAEFFDAILLGDGEEAILEIAETIRQAKELQLDRQETLARLTEIAGLYVPSLFEPQYDKEGRLQQIKPLKPGYEKVNRRILPDLESVDGPFPPLVPLVRIVHDRLGVEVARGCTRGCRFCQAGIIYRPVRERSAEKVVKLAEQGITAGGFEELALLSLSTGDYSCLSPALGRLMDTFVKQYVSVSMPSMRVGTLTPEIIQQIKKVRKTGFTLAPEAGTDRLRQVINKGITEEDLLDTCREVFAHGWKLIKFYFMFGLPTETMDDVKAISELVRKATKTAAGKNPRINVSVATFVPKPHTPFQWEPQLSIEEGYERIDLLKKSLPKSCKLKWHNPRQSFLEGVMSRGDRHLSMLIEEAWKLGSRLDAWTEHFDLELWQKAGAACNIDLAEYLRQRDLSEILPWQHLDTGVDESFLMAEFFKALEGMYTEDCRVHACQKCGACDFKTIKPVVQCKIKDSDIQESIEK
ncbi:MAG: TIGR03960 family B12-binding radical SAM protein, partial [Proteobacteria bacterium]|nr:TIGR03960 family B12-binding radical SAM protein [Pseudomonadota bacterium]